MLNELTAHARVCVRKSTMCSLAEDCKIPPDALAIGKPRMIPYRNRTGGLPIDHIGWPKHAHFVETVFITRLISAVSDII